MHQQGSRVPGVNKLSVVFASVCECVMSGLLCCDLRQQNAASTAALSSNTLWVVPVVEGVSYVSKCIILRRSTHLSLTSAAVVSYMLLGVNVLQRMPGIISFQSGAPCVLKLCPEVKCSMSLCMTLESDLPYVVKNSK